MSWRIVAQNADLYEALSGASNHRRIGDTSRMAASGRRTPADVESSSRDAPA